MYADREKINKADYEQLYTALLPRRQNMLTLLQQALSSGLISATSGNLSCFCREQGVMLITPTALRYENMQADDMVMLRTDGTILGGCRAPSSEWRMHAAIYEGREDVNAIFHTHSPYATAFAVNRSSIPAALIEAHLFLGGDIRCAAYATPGTRALGEKALLALENRGGCTLANHGVLAIAADAQQALLRAEYIEDMARIYAIAKSIGQPVELSAL